MKRWKRAVRRARFRAGTVLRRAHTRARGLRASLPVRVGLLRTDTGLATAEYAIVMIAAVGFAGLLLVILRSAEVRELLLGLIRTALSP